MYYSSLGTYRFPIVQIDNLETAMHVFLKDKQVRKRSVLERERKRLSGRPFMSLANTVNPFTLDANKHLLIRF